MFRRTRLKSKTPLRANGTLRRQSLLRKSLFDKETDIRSESFVCANKPKRKRRTTPNYVADMDKVFQYYVRLRDAMPGGYTKCISCGKIKSFDQMQGGHYMSRRHMSIRWNELNVNAECSYCNGMDGDHLIGYRKNLIKKIGEGKVEWLEGIRHEVKHWCDFELKIMIKHYCQEAVNLSSSKKIPLSHEVQRIVRRYEKIPL